MPYTTQLWLSNEDFEELKSLAYRLNLPVKEAGQAMLKWTLRMMRDTGAEFDIIPVSKKK